MVGQRGAGEREVSPKTCSGRLMNAVTAFAVGSAQGLLLVHTLRLGRKHM